MVMAHCSGNDHSFIKASNQIEIRVKSKTAYTHYPPLNNVNKQEPSAKYNKNNGKPRRQLGSSI